MVGNCAVPRCNSTYYKSAQIKSGIAVFSVPKTAVGLWQQQIPSIV
ncbi:Uncharacterized protein APZ42_000659 [Daphnia magna]|uniref:THAP-type domain-containing protein n=1 Tax=Daphnia magna TaxID=35525 RepID=A0A164JH22_9CRUS|nr:Uncharacterized protein APZ42_000659 [Daphnia magna]